MTPLLRVRDLVVEFSTPAGMVRAVDGVNLDVKHGERIGIVGESGSGKSVFSRAVMGLLGPREAKISGTVEFNGRSVLDMTQRERRSMWGRETAMVFQDPLSSLHPITPIGAQVTEAVRRDPSYSKAQAAKRAVELLDMVGIPQAEERSRARAHELSGGMRQRVMIAIAMACRPQLLFADEPTTALDVTVQARILDLFDELCREFEIGLIMVSHDLGVVAHHCDTVAVMYAGQIGERGPVGEVLGSPSMRYTEALLQSIPRMDEGSDRTLPKPIGGLPPSLLAPPPGCRFAPRCSHAVAACVEVRPVLTPHAASAKHEYACWNPAEEEVSK